MDESLNFDVLPRPNPRRIALHIHPEAERAIRQGHPWLYESAITRQSHQGQAGDWAVIYDKKNRFMALGLYDPASPIRVKLLHQGQPLALDAAWFAQRIAACAALRQPLQAGRTTGYRLIHGENDGLPGLVVDRYDETLVVKLYSAAWLPHLPDVVAGLHALHPWEGAVLRLSRRLQSETTLHDGMVLWGAPRQEPIFMENGLRFSTDVVHGHKTGFFFDQRDNRARVGALAEGRRVLDVFAYSGGFSVYAGAGGALSALAVDISAPALEAAQANWTLNADHGGFRSAHLDRQVGDAFDVMERLRSQHRFGLVVVDPPSLAKRADEVPGALAQYEALIHTALPLCDDGAVLMMASCSSRVSAEQFDAVIERGLRRSRRRWEIIERTGHALDHPVGFAEGAYLKALFIQLD